MEIWQYGDMARVKTTVSVDEELMRHVRVRAARTGQTQSEVLDEALREGWGWSIASALRPRPMKKRL